MPKKKPDIAPADDTVEIRTNFEMSKEIATNVWPDHPVTSELVFGIYDRVFDPEIDDEERDEIIRDLIKAVGEAKRLFGTPTVKDVFETYERFSTDFFGEED